MKRLLSTTCLGLLLATGLAGAQSLDVFAADARAAMPQSAPVPIDDLLGPVAADQLPTLTDLPTDGPATGDGQFDAALWSEFGMSVAEAVGPLGAPGPPQILTQGQPETTPEISASGSIIQPVEPPTDWVWHDLQGTRFAVPGDMMLMEEDRDNVAFFRGIMAPPTGQILMIGIDGGSGDTIEEVITDMQSEGLAPSTTGEITFPDGSAFDWADVQMTKDGISMTSRMYISRDLFGEDDDPMLIAAGSVGGAPLIDEATLASFIGSIRLGPSTPRVDQSSTVANNGSTQPMVMQPALDGLLNVPVPDGWAFADLANEAVLTAPDGIGTVRFARGPGALDIIAGIDSSISVTATWMNGGMARGYTTVDRHALVWETCPTPGVPLALLASGVAGFPEDPGYSAVLSRLGVTMPAGAMPCGAEIQPGARTAPRTAEGSGGATMMQLASGTQIKDIGGVRLALSNDWATLFLGPTDGMFRSADGQRSLVVKWQQAGAALLDPATVTSTTRRIIGGQSAVLTQARGLRATASALIEQPRADGRQFMLLLDSGSADPAVLESELIQLAEGIDWGEVLVPIQQVVPQQPMTPADMPVTGMDSDTFTDLGGSYTTYHNSRYGMEISYPSSYFNAGEAPGNGDGRQFHSTDGQAQFLVFSQYDALDQGLNGMLAEAKLGLDSVASEAAVAGFFTLSGSRGSDTVFRKVIRNADGLTRTFEITYPASRADEFRAVVRYMADSFGPAAALIAPVPQPPQTATVPQPPATTAQDPSGLKQSPSGVWSILTSTGFSGRLTLGYGPDGLAGYVTFDALRRDEILMDVSFDPATGILTFLRPDVHQAYRATIVGDRIEGAYNNAPGGGYASTFDGTRVERDDFVPDDLGSDGVALQDPVVVAPDTGVPITVGVLRTPARDTRERASLMDTARGPIQSLIGLPVIFVVSVLNTDGTWAYLQATPVNPDGSPINWNRTPFGRDIANGFMSDVAMVLMRRESGAWRPVEFAFGPTDVAWYDWVQSYGLPERLFLK